jgi:Cu/Ag efflux protein CusF
MRIEAAIARRLTQPFARALLLAALGGAAVFTSAVGEGSAVAAETYSARGVVKSFGKDRAYVNIAHEKIAGYMEAMTMSFDAKTPEQLAGLAAGDHVTFRFTVIGDKRVLDEIKKD